MSHNVYFYAQTGLPDPAVWEVSLSDVKGDYTVELEDREDGAPVYGEILQGGEELVEFELYTPAQTAPGFGGDSGKEIFDEALELAKSTHAKGNPDIIAQLEKTSELLVCSVQWGERNDEQVFRALEPMVDWLHRTATGIRYEDGIGFYNAASKL